MNVEYKDHVLSDLGEVYHLDSMEDFWAAVATEDRASRESAHRKWLSERTPRERLRRAWQEARYRLSHAADALRGYRCEDDW